MERSGIRIESLAPGHARRVAELHAAALPQGFLSSLGPAFLARLYRGIAATHRAAVLTAVDGDGRCVGFVAGCAAVGSCYGQVLRRDPIGLALRAAPALLRPSAWRRVLETLLYPRRGGAEAPASEAELLALAVGPEARRRGVGRLLVGALEARLEAWGVAGAYRVVTDAEDPRSNAFYEGVGFVARDTFHHHGHPMRLYRKALGRSREAAA